jgi:adenylate kinase
MDLVLFGMQGSGKGTQSQYIATRCDFQIFETGAELRKLAKEESELGKKVKEIMESGNLVSTSVVMEIIANFISQLPIGTNVLFDGIPRSEDQMQQFNDLMIQKKRTFKGLLIKISEGEALNRLTTRRLCSQCKSVYPVFYKANICKKCNGELTTRRDDTPEAIRTRLDTFIQKTMPVIDKYHQKGLLISVNGEQKIEDVSIDIMSALKREGIHCEA